MFYQKMLTEQKKLDTQIQSLQNQLARLPKGSLMCTKNGKYFKWYHLLSNKLSYIPKKERDFAQQLALKKFITLQLKNYQNEKKAIDAYLKHRNPATNSVDTYFTSHPEFQNLLSDTYKPLSHELHLWADADFEKNTQHSDKLIQKTISGNVVRSKSEALIDTLLHINQIPFRYECALHLDEITLFPDFTIRHPVTGKTYYWEHFGLMDDPAYIKNACSKLQQFAGHGIIPSIHLITTFETQEYPLTSDSIEKIIQEYFLS